MVWQLVLFFLSFLFIWFGSGLIVKSVDHLAHRLNLSAFATSFFVLGILTSTPEATVGLNSVLNGRPEIFIGNLIGGSLVIFLFIIPVLAIFGNGIKLSHQLNEHNLILSLLVIFAPVVFILDKKISFSEGFSLVLLYFILFYFIEKRKGLFEKIKDKFIHDRNHFMIDILKIFAGALIIFFSSKIIVEETIYFSRAFKTPSYLIALLILSIGTNLPELSLAARSVVLKKKEVAFGDYLGSAAANTLIFGLLTIGYGGNILLVNHFLVTLVFMAFGLSVFYLFSRSKNDISRQEGIVLFLVYLLFLFFETTV